MEKLLSRGTDHNRRKYVVAVSDGVAIKEYECTDRYEYTDGFVFEYTNDKAQKDLVLVPRKYRYGQLDGRLIIGKNAGNSSAAAMVGAQWMIGHSVDPNAPGEDLSLLARTHVDARGYKTLYEKTVPWKWLIIGIAALVIVVAIVWFARSQGA